MDLIGNTNAEKIWNYLKAKGLNDYGVAGLIGNLYAESALNPKNLQNSYEKSLGYTDDTYTAAVDSGLYGGFVNDAAGYGLAQWTYWPRKQALLAYCMNAGASIGDLDAQLNFLIKELSESYPDVLNTLKNASSVLEASNAVLLKFERPADQSTSVQSKRASYGQSYYDKYAVENTDEDTVGGDCSMKYNDSNKPLRCIMTNSTCYRKSYQMNVVGVLWHCTGANNPTIKRYVQPSIIDADYYNLMNVIGKNSYGNDWNHIDIDAGVNAWIGKLADGSVSTVQTLPWSYRPWGCGSGSKGSCNSGWIQFEICEDDLSDATYFNECYKEACELTAYLCKMYNIDPQGYVYYNGVTVPTILCHWDSYKLGLGSGHSDVYNWFERYGKTMQNVRDDVEALLCANTANTVHDETTVVNYQGKVAVNSVLNCRDEPINGSVIMTYPNGAIITITKECNGWGYTGVGWVCLDYVTKIEDSPVVPSTPGVPENPTKTDETEDDDMTQEKFNEMMNVYLKGLQDNDCGQWSADGRNFVIDKGLFVGNGTTVNGEPNYMWGSFLTREQFAVVMKRFAELNGLL